MTVGVERERGIGEEPVAPIRRVHVLPALPTVLRDVRLGEDAKKGARALLVEVVQVRVRSRDDVGGVRRIHGDRGLVVWTDAVAVEQGVASERGWLRSRR